MIHLLDSSLLLFRSDMLILTYRYLLYIFTSSSTINGHYRDDYPRSLMATQVVNGMYVGCRFYDLLATFNTRFGQYCTFYIREDHLFSKRLLQMKNKRKMEKNKIKVTK